MVSEPTTALRLDLGSGPHPSFGFTGVDSIAFSPEIAQCNLGAYGWPWPDNSVDEAKASHVIEHLTGQQRIAFCNELYRVLKPKAICVVTVPHWASHRAYGDLTHQWPPVSESWFEYLSAMWRELYAPHTDESHMRTLNGASGYGYSCDFDVQWSAVYREDIAIRHRDYQEMARTHYKDVILDMIAIFTKRG